MKGNASIIVVCLVSMLLALMPLALGAVIGSGLPHQQATDHDGQPSLIEAKGRTAEDTSFHPTLVVRHIRSVTQPQQSNDLMEDNNSIQSNSESEEEEPEAVHKAQKSFVSPDMFPQQQNFRMQTAPKGPALHKWLFRGMGQSQFPRGLRRDSHFIRFGRNSNSDFDSFNLAGANNNGNKKNNFIRLGRENPRRNNFIRLGRSGLWGNNDRFGSKIGYFPDYYSQVFGGNPNIWDFEAQQPIPFDPSDVIMQG